LSSAILYVAIVAIWACVLIPRWLRRDSSASAPVSSSPSSSAEARVDDQVTGGADEEPEPSDRHRDDQAEAQTEGRSAPGEARSAPGESWHVPLGPGHRKVLSARRRLLVLLVALTAAAGVLAGTRLAAWWVIVPPSVMLGGYLLLLRAAAKADAERRELTHGHARARAAHAAAAAPAAPLTRAEVLAFSGPSALEGQDDQEIYDQYADAKLRAVGD